MKYSRQTDTERDSTMGCRLVIIATATLALTCAGASGQTMMGAGTISCGDWIHYRSAETGNGDPQQMSAAYQAEAWIDGFLSGYNTGTPRLDILKSQPSGFALNAWIDNYCKAKPLDPIAAAAVALVKELKQRAQNQ